MLEKERLVIREKLASLSRQDVELYATKPKPKDQESAEESRLLGNKLFQRKMHLADMHQDIWQLYTLSIALSPTGSEALALAYANRSALLIHMSKFKDCILDIDRAVDITKSNLLKAKWLCRKVKCLHALDESLGAEKILQEATNYFNQSTGKSQDIIKVKGIIDSSVKLLKTKSLRQHGEKVDPILLELRNKQDDFSNVTNKYNSKFGRHLVATRDIDPGEIIFVERPYCVSIVHLNIPQFFCSHCHSCCITTIPCDFCTSLMFCSDLCKNNAWSEYHDIECLVYRDFTESCGSDSLIHAILFIIITEWRKSGGIANLKTLVQSFSENRERNFKNLISDGRLKRDKFQALYDSVYETSDNFLDFYLKMALPAITSLAVNSTFFGRKYEISECNHLVDNEDVIFIGSLFLRVAEFATNGLSIDNVYANSNNLDCPARGNSISAVFSLINHNCDPNAGRCFSQDNSIVCFALKPIKKDDQIFQASVDNYRISVKEIRQRELKKNHDFICDCQACVENWPPLLRMGDDTIMKHPYDYERYLFKKPKDMELFQKNKTVVEKLFKPLYGFQFDQRMISDLSKSVVEACTEISQPSVITCFLIATLNMICMQLYSSPYPLPSKCTTNKFPCF